jgi:hypothetical protein
VSATLRTRPARPAIDRCFIGGATPFREG